LHKTISDDFAAVTAVRPIWVRDDSFAPVGKVSDKVFTASESDGFDDDTGECLAATGSPSDWSDNEEITNDQRRRRHHQGGYVAQPRLW